MGTIFKRTEKRPVPAVAEIVEKGGKRVARWKRRGKMVTAAILTENGADWVAVKSAVYVARFRDHAGRLVERSTGCKDETAARQVLARWEREAEQVKAGILDADALTVARAAAGPLKPLLDLYERSLIARNVSTVYRQNAMRAICRLIDEVPLASVKDLRREIVEQWLANALQSGMKSRTRNYYRDAIVRFANWCRENGKIQSHDLDKLPKADERTDPVRPRRALTEQEFARLLSVARTRPLDDARTVRRGGRKGERIAELRPEVVHALDELGRERTLIYQTFVLTGLRLNELRTLTVGNLDLTPGNESIRLESANEKNRSGSTLPIRADLADELRQWITERRLTPSSRLFNVPVGLRRILDRDLRAAGIPKRDGRGRTIDVHALRHTFATWLSSAGVTPRTAQSALRHSDIKLTMNVYTDPALLAVREALDKLPGGAANRNPDQNPPRIPHFENDFSGVQVTISDRGEQLSQYESDAGEAQEMPRNLDKKSPVLPCDDTGHLSGRRDLNPRPLAPQASALAKLRYGPSGMLDVIQIPCS